MQHGKAVRGFATPSRKFEIRSLFVHKIGKNEDCSELIAASGVTRTKNRPDNHKGHELEVDPMPSWFQPIEHQDLADDELIMTSFKWNVHNHGRTMNLKWLAEIVHSNPAWLNPKTAAKFGLRDGDWIELTSYYSRELEQQSPHLRRDDLRGADGRGVISTMRVPIVIMEGIHPRAIAMSNSCGHWQYTSVAQARRRPATTGHSVGCDGASFYDADWERNMWWEDASSGDPANWKPNTGNGWNQNRLMPIAPDPVSGQQAFHDTVVTIKKVG
jgi:anaerobic selenocysteine-containing dehydrogenase